MVYPCQNFYAVLQLAGVFNMKTSKWISTISYNTDKYLAYICNKLIDERYIYFWCYIEHYPEADERKKHKHLLMFPNGRIDTDSIAARFDEYVDGEEAPRRVMPFRTSKFDDAYLYMIHEKRYLLSKGLTKKYYYDRENIVCSEVDYLIEMIHSIDMSRYKRLDFLIEAVDHDISFSHLLASGRIPIPQIRAYKDAYETLYSNAKFKAEREYFSKIEVIDGKQISFHDALPIYKE